MTTSRSGSAPRRPPTGNVTFDPEGRPLRPGNLPPMQWRGTGGRLATAVLGAVVAAVLVAGTAGCGGDDGADGALQGLVRTPPLVVGEVTLPRVAPDGTEEPFAFRAPEGHLLVTYFGYTNCPDLCPTTMADLRTAFEELGDDAGRIDVAFVTVDPDRDDPATVNAYLGSFFGRGTHAVRTTDPDALVAAEDAFLATSSVTTADDGKVTVSHTGITYVIDPSGVVQVEWPFGTSPEVMAQDLRLVLDRVPASGGAGSAGAATLPLSFSDAWARVTPAGADTAAAYVTIRSNADVADRIVGVDVDPAVASTAELHRSTGGAGGTMTMEPAGEVTVPAGGTLVLEPGGLHVMLMGLERPLVAGERFSLSLVFERAGRQELSVEVRER